MVLIFVLLYGINHISYSVVNRGLGNKFWYFQSLTGLLVISCTLSKERPCWIPLVSPFISASKVESIVEKVERVFEYSLDFLEAEWSYYALDYVIEFSFYFEQNGLWIRKFCFEMGSRLLLKLLGPFSDVNGALILRTNWQVFNTAWVSWGFNSQFWHCVLRESIRSTG